MGWSSGSEIMGEIIHALDKTKIPDGTRFKLYKRLIPALQNQDWDTEDECMGEDPQYDKALRSLHPEWFRDEA
jgi:hypothetical protein